MEQNLMVLNDAWIENFMHRHAEITAEKVINILVKSGIGKSPQAEDKLLTTEEALSYLGIGRTTLWHRTNDGYINPIRDVGGKINRYRKSELDAYLVSLEKKGGEA